MVRLESQISRLQQQMSPFGYVKWNRMNSELLKMTESSPDSSRNDQIENKLATKQGQASLGSFYGKEAYDTKYNFDMWFSLAKVEIGGVRGRATQNPPTFQRPVITPKYNITVNHTWLVAF